MKKILSAAALAAQLIEPAAAADLDLLVENIREPQGMLLWSVYDSAEHYDTGQSPVITARSRVSGATLRVTLRDLPPGNYAVKLFHDANGNGELDSNMLGMPQEGYGFSNNAGRFGPASFEDAALTLESDTQIVIRLR